LLRSSKYQRNTPAIRSKRMRMVKVSVRMG
jgi:hypothetical protein